MEETQFLVQWDEHPTHLATRLGYLLEHQSLVDVTLMCNTHTLKVHRAVLAACSPYFERQLGNHPLIVLKDMKFSVLKSLVEFMYCGETSVSEENLTPLLEAAKFFEVKGLAAMTKESVRYSNTSGIRLNGSTPQLNQIQTPVYMRGTSGGRGRGRGRGRPPLSSKVSSPTEPAQILLSLSGGANQPSSPQLFTTSRNVKIDPSVLGDVASKGGKASGGMTESGPRRRGRRRSALNTAIRERILRDSEGGSSEDGSAPLLSSLLSRPDQADSSDCRYLQTLRDFGLPTDVPILYDDGQGKLVKLTENVLKTVIGADADVQFHIAEGSLQEADVQPTPDVVASPTTPKGDNTMCEMVFDKENKNFVIKETRATFEADRLNDTDLESLKNGVATEAESDPEAVVMFEVTDNKKVQKCVLSAKDIDTLKVLNERLSKQKSQLADMTNGLSAVEVAGNAQIAELKLKITKTTSVLAQIVEKVRGLKDLRESPSEVSNESNCINAPRPAQQSQVVQLEFIDGNGEKIEGYQVEGTVVENRLDKKRDGGSGKESDLMCLLDMVCDDGERGNSMMSAPEEEEGPKECQEEEVEDGEDDSLMTGEKEDINYHLVMNDHLGSGGRNMAGDYENIEDMMTGEADGNPTLAENKNQYIIDNDGNIINQDESYAVYHDVKEEMASNEYVIYDGSESVLPDMAPAEEENYDEEDGGRNVEVCSSSAAEEYIVYSEGKSTGDLGEEMDSRGLSPTAQDTQRYIMYSDDNQDPDSNKQCSGKEEEFVMFSSDKISEDEVDSLLDKPSCKTLPGSDLLPALEEDDSFPGKDSPNPLLHKRRSSTNSDSSDRSTSKKQRLTSLQPDIDSS